MHGKEIIWKPDRCSYRLEAGLKFEYKFLRKNQRWYFPLLDYKGHSHPSTIVYAIWTLNDIKRAGVPPVSPKTEEMAGVEGGRVVFKGLNRLSFPSWRPYFLQVPRAVAGWKTSGLSTELSARKWICRVWTLIHGHMHVEKRACRTWRLRTSSRRVAMGTLLLFVLAVLVSVSPPPPPHSPPFLSLLAPQFSCPMHRLLSSPSFSFSFSPRSFLPTLLRLSRRKNASSLAAAFLHLSRRYVVHDFNDSGTKGDIADSVPATEEVSGIPRSSLWRNECAIKRIATMMSDQWRDNVSGILEILLVT